MNKRVSRRALLAAAGVLGLGGGALLLSSRARNPLQRAQAMGLAQRIVVGFGEPSTFFVPPYRPVDAKIVGVETTAVQPTALASALDGVEGALSRYPAGFVGSVIKAIFIAGSIRIEGALAGGTYGPAWILLAAPVDIGAASIELTCRIGVHHELSSFVYLRGDTVPRWLASEPSGWSFAGSAARQLADDKAAAPPAGTGFLNAYGATSPENDFNVYAEKLMTEMGAVMQLAASVPLVARKVALVRHAYLAIDPRMEHAFTELGMKASLLPPIAP
ncbi:MAG: hypothetical protein ABI671_02640 [Burkholderiales bacterium]